MVIGRLIEQFFSEIDSKFDLNTKSKTILLGPIATQLNIYFEGYIANLIIGAFIDNVENEPEFKISVYMLDDFDMWKEKLQESIPGMNLDVPFPFKITSPYRLFICDSQSQIYFLDNIERHGVILLRETSFLDTRSYITPFRLMVSWILDNFDGEVIHASAISKNGRALLISGEKGTGKSTLALAWVNTGGEILSDDAVVIIDNRVYAIYTRAKIDVANVYTRSLIKYSFNLKDRQDAKYIMPLLSLGSKFVISAEVKNIVIPKQSKLTTLITQQKALCRNSFVDNSLREIFGGDEANIKRLNQIVDMFDLTVLESSSEIQQSMDILFKELSCYE